MNTIFSYRKNIIMLLLLVSNLALAQIGINTNTPNATLHINFDKGSINTETPPGIIAPNLLLSDLIKHKELYSSPQSGAYVYISEIDSSIEEYPDLVNINNPGYYFFDGMTWNVFALSNNNTTILEPWFSTDTNLGATLNTENIYHIAQVGIGKNGPIDHNAQLEITSSSKGLIIPRLTKAERDAITNPTISMIIWNKDELCFNFYKGEEKGWKSICENTGEADFIILDCLSAKVGGDYIVGTAVTDDNYLQITVNVNEKGSYNIEGTTNVGLFFQKNGTFPSEGTFTIRIPAYGSPNKVISNSIPEEYIKISINGALTDCEIPITTINNQSLRYTLDRSVTPNIIADNLVKNEPSTNKKIILKINVLTPGVTDITAANNEYGIAYHAYNQDLKLETNQVILYSDGDPVPNSFNGNQIPFTLSGPGFEHTLDENIFNINVVTNEATFTNCTTSSVNGTYVTGKALTTSNYVNVTVNVATLGTYYYEAKNENANIKFTASGHFTKTGSQTIKALASTITNGFIGDPNNYTFTPKINGTVNCNAFNLNVIHTTKKVLFIGDKNLTAKKLLDNPLNFGTTGKFKIENVITTLDIYADQNIFTTQKLLKYINVDKYQMIVFPVTMGNFILTPQHYQILADFIQQKNGIVIFTSGTNMETHTKGVIDKMYPSNNLSFNNSIYTVHSTSLPSLPADISSIEYKFLNGVFGNISEKYYLGLRPFSWLGVTGNLPTGLKTLVGFRDNSYGTARNTFIYTETPGLFIFPGDVTLFEENSYYGKVDPIGPSIAIYGNAPTYNSNTNSISNIQLPIGQSIGYLMLGNVFAESFKHLEKYYLPDEMIY